MESVLRAAVVYAFVFVLLRLSGRRTIGQLGSFDLVLLLIIGEACQQALLGKDGSITNAVLVVLTLVLVDQGLALWKSRSDRVARLLDGVPLPLVHDGKVDRDHLDRELLSVGDVLRAAREQHGLERIDQVKVAFLEPDGRITVVPR